METKMNFEYDEVSSGKPTLVHHESAVEESHASRRAEKDHNELVAVGKRPVLQRNFGFIAMIGFSCTILITWEATLPTLGNGIGNGGPSGIIYGYLLVWAGSTAIYASLCELASMAPTSGGQYHWVSMLAPPSYRVGLGYLTGWYTVIGWQANFAASLFLCADMVQGLVLMNDPNAPKTKWQTVLIFWAILALTLLINAVVSKLLPVFESTILVLHILGLPAIVITLAFLAPHATPADVFNHFTNEGNQFSTGFAVLVGLLGTIFAFLGGDGAIHMSEEIRGASVIVPRSLLLSVFINGVMGFGTVIAVLFFVQDLDAAANSITGFPFMEIFLRGVKSQAGATVLVAIILIMQFSCGVGLMAATSRLTWSFARDRGLPGWKYISRVNQKTYVPLTSVLVTAGISVLLSLIILGSDVAFNNLVSICIVGTYGSYLIAISLLLYRRLAGDIKVGNYMEGELKNTLGAQLVWGPWKLPNWLGLFANCFACAWILLVVFVSFWPSIIPVTVENMQYSSLVVVGVLFLATLWYLVVGRRQYTGPVIEIRR